MKLNKADEQSHASSSGSNADVFISAEYLNPSVLESGVHMVRSHQENLFPCVYFEHTNKEMNGTSSHCFRWAASEPKKM